MKRLARLAASGKDLAPAAWRLYLTCPGHTRLCTAPVAQLDRALPSEGRGREFESRRVRHRFYNVATTLRLKGQPSASLGSSARREGNDRGMAVAGRLPSWANVVLSAPA